MRARYQQSRELTTIGTVSGVPQVAEACLEVGLQPPCLYCFVDAQLMHPMRRVAQETVLALPCEDDKQHGGHEMHME